MNDPIYGMPLRAIRKFYTMYVPNSSHFGRNWQIFPMKEYANNLIAETLDSDKPAMIARFGSNELNCMTNFLGVNAKRDLIGFIKGKKPAWWWENWMMKQMNEVAGFFPKEPKYFEQFSKLMIEDLAQVDILGSWRKEEVFFQEGLSSAKKVMLEDLDPFFVKNPWTHALKGKKVLVVHPFALTIHKQFAIKEKLFNPTLLPDFELITLKAVQSHGNGKTEYSTWFEALQSMKDKMDNIDFDICILGCGAYGFPLAAHVKKIGKKSVHLGGVSQLLFGIKGKRYEKPMTYPYHNLFNEHWVRPDESEKPENTNIVEGACYW